MVEVLLKMDATKKQAYLMESRKSRRIIALCTIRQKLVRCVDLQERSVMDQQRSFE